MKTHKEPKQLVAENQHLTFDVVCGMDIVTEKARSSSVFYGVTYYFCSPHCQQHFENNPERYVWEK
jgi:YHS domain-containing protein